MIRKGRELHAPWSCWWSCSVLELMCYKRHTRQDEQTRGLIGGNRENGKEPAEWAVEWLASVEKEGHAGTGNIQNRQVLESSEGEGAFKAAAPFRAWLGLWAAGRLQVPHCTHHWLEAAGGKCSFRGKQQMAPVSTQLGLSVSYASAVRDLRGTFSWSSTYGF